MPNPPPTPEALAQPAPSTLTLARSLARYFFRANEQAIGYDDAMRTAGLRIDREHRQPLVEAARKYDRGHHPGCERLRLSGGPCNCGYDDLRAALAKEP